MAESDINTIPRLAQRAREEGLPISECTIRKLIKSGSLPARFIGRKALVSYSALVRYFSCADGCDNLATPAAGLGIRRVEL